MSRFLRRRKNDPKTSEITEEAVYLRRDVLVGGALAALSPAST